LFLESGLLVQTNLVMEDDHSRACPRWAILLVDFGGAQSNPWEQGLDEWVSAGQLALQSNRIIRNRQPNLPEKDNAWAERRQRGQTAARVRLYTTVAAGVPVRCSKAVCRCE
jgi:hypothetical protein